MKISPKNVPPQYQLNVVITAPNSVLDQLPEVEPWIFASVVPVARELRNTEARVCYVVTGREALLAIAETLATAMPDASLEFFALSNDSHVPSETAGYRNGRIDAPWTERDFDSVLRDLDQRWYKSTGKEDGSRRETGGAEVKASRSKHDEGR